MLANAERDSSTDGRNVVICGGMALGIVESKYRSMIAANDLALLRFIEFNGYRLSDEIGVFDNFTPKGKTINTGSEL
jgi:hypothetical protein